MQDKETIDYLDLKFLVPFQNHPFKLRDGEEKEQLLQSIKTQGAWNRKTACYRPQIDQRAGSFHDGRCESAPGKHIAQ